jgi:iron complex outermembrane receptor protein
MQMVLIFICISVSQNLLSYGQQKSDSSNHNSFADSAFWFNEVSVEAYQINARLLTIPGNLLVVSGSGLSAGDGTGMTGIMNMMPGVSLQSGTYTTNRMVIRGMGSRTPYNTNRIRSYLNDMPVTGADGISAVEEIDLQGISRIEVVKGPSSALYGSGLGGTLNLFAAVPPEDFIKGSIQYGSYHTGKFGVSGAIRGNKTGVYYTFSHMQSDGYRENNTHQRTSLLSTVSRGSQKTTLDFTMLLMNVDAGIPSSTGITLFETNPRAAAPNWFAAGGYKKYTKGLAGLTLGRKLSTHITNRFTVFGKVHDSYEKRPFNNLDDITMGAGLRNRLNLHYDKTDWVLGAEWLAEVYRWTLDTSSVRINKNRENRNQLNIFALLYYQPLANLNISLAGAVNLIGYRLTDLYLANGDQTGVRIFPVVFSPRLGLNYKLFPNGSVYASASHGFSMPSPEEALLPEGAVNDQIKPEQGWQFEAGMRLNLFNSRLGIDGTLYWIELKDLLVTKRLTEDIFTGTNAGRTRHRGMELMINGNLFSYERFPGKLVSIVSYTRSWNRFIDFTDDGNVYDGNHLPGIPGQLLSARLQWNTGSLFTVDITIRYTGNQYLDDGNTLKYEGYPVADLKLTADIPVKCSGTLQIYAGINNLTNTHYASMLVVNARGFGGTEPRYYYPGLPRHFYAGIRFML